MVTNEDILSFDLRLREVRDRLHLYAEVDRFWVWGDGLAPGYTDDEHRDEARGFTQAYRNVRLLQSELQLCREIAEQELEAGRVNIDLLDSIRSCQAEIKEQQMIASLAETAGKTEDAIDILKTAVQYAFENGGASLVSILAESSGPPPAQTDRGREGDESPAYQSLNASGREAYHWIARNPGRGQKEVASAIGVSHDHFRKDIVPKLRKAGVYNDGGEFPPSA